MFKVTLQNIENPNRSWSATFPTELEATGWLEAQKLKEGRKPTRVEIRSIRQEDESFIETEFVLPAEAVYSIQDISAQVAQESTNRTAREFLRSTDWYILRQVDSGVPCPQEILDQREAARNSVVD